MATGFDLISDLNLSDSVNFDWSEKATSLYCIIAGNLGNNTNVVYHALSKLSKHYQGIFYIAGSLEYEGVTDINARTDHLSRICEQFQNIAFLHHNVVVIDGIAIVGSNGWYKNTLSSGEVAIDELINMAYYEDLLYLKNTIERLQKHLDVKKIIIVSNSVPNDFLYFGETPPKVKNQVPIDIVLESDTMKKVSYWAYGTYKKIVDITINDINYFCNPCFGSTNYWAKRINLEI